MDLEAEPLPQSVPIPVCLCRTGAMLSYQAQACPAIMLGLGTEDAGTRLWGLEGETSLPAPSGQADGQLCRGTTHGCMPATARVTAGSFMSPSPRCSAASLVNWESEMKHCSSGREELHTLGTSGPTHLLGPVTQGELTSGYRKGLTPKLQIPAENKGGEEGREVFPCSRGTPLSARDPWPGAGHRWDESHRNAGALCGVGDSRDAAAAPPISHVRSPVGSEDMWGWQKAWVAVPSGSSFPRNPLGATLGIPGNTVLGATAWQLETAHPVGSYSPWKSCQQGTGPLGGAASGRGSPLATPNTGRWAMQPRQPQLPHTRG